MRIAALFSGGKDSNYALFCARHFGWDVTHLVTVFSRSQESYMYHVPAIELTRLAASSIGIPLVEVVTPPEREVELIPLRDTLASLNVDGIVSGALASEYQRRRLDQICEDIGIKSFSPIWHKNPRDMVREMVDEGFEIMIAGCYAEGLDERWLGRILDEKALDALDRLHDRYGIHVAGEGGEYESVVLYGPHMRQRICVDYEKDWKIHSGKIIVKRAWLEDAK
ncbi:TIGR00289 family protein [Methanocella sp. CWC-04]|uniref:TIGR00289 family protein n=1 Tax=Methanooceanicella nereidis TaxID=2052831 RepID=A0AAP2W7K0_9EURY|nr:diphthine--ammonia ligase [Methanocella sp. CWC-04]MCD1295151.1 TIGR00289 family protein [Methanocella sp. CWC-04]